MLWLSYGVVLSSQGELFMRFSKLALAIILTVGAANARADQTFTFSYSFPGTGGPLTLVTASGLLTTTDLNTNTNAYTILGISGKRVVNGTPQTIMGLLAPGSFGSNDNLLFAAAPMLDVNGFTYIVNGVGNSGADVNVYYDAATTSYSENDPNIDYGPLFTITRVTTVPEPSTNALLLSLTLMGAGFFARRRKKARRVT